MYAQLRQQQQQLSGSSSHSTSGYLMDKPVSDPLSAVQEMALSAVIQQHNSVTGAHSSSAPLVQPVTPSLVQPATPSLVQPTTPSLHSNGNGIKSYYMQTSGGAIVSLQNNTGSFPEFSMTSASTASASLSSLSATSSSSPVIGIASLAGGTQFPQGPNVLLGPSAGTTIQQTVQSQPQQPGYIALHSPSPSSNGPTPSVGGVASHQQTGPTVIQPQTTPTVKLPPLPTQFQDASGVQFTPVTYAPQGRSLQTTPTPGVANLQQANLVG